MKPFITYAIACCNSSEYLLGIRLNFPAFILTANDNWFAASNGGLKAASSYTRHPNALR